MTNSSIPPGWPPEVRPPGAPDWQRSAVAWLFDVCPPDYRGYPVLRHHPIVLARLADTHAAANAAAAREGLTRARADLREVVSPEVVEAAVGVLEQEVRRLATVQRGVELVEAALRGRRFVAQL